MTIDSHDHQHPPHGGKHNHHHEADIQRHPNGKGAIESWHRMMVMAAVVCIVAMVDLGSMVVAMVVVVVMVLLASMRRVLMIMRVDCHSRLGKDAN